jgi:hypothetical protein
MRISFDVNVKAVLAVVAVGALCVGSFFAGEYHQAHKPQAITDPDPYAAKAEPIKAGDTLIIPESAAADHEVLWCKAHPDTKWTFGPAKPDPSDSMHLSDGLIPIHGGCDAAGKVWVISDK